MNKDLKLKQRITKNWLTIVLAFAFIITLSNYFQVRKENQRLQNHSGKINQNIKNVKSENSELEQNNSEIEQNKSELEQENQELKEKNQDLEDNI